MPRNMALEKRERLSAYELSSLPDGDHLDGGGLQLNKRGQWASWVMRFTNPAGRHRAMGLGAAHLESVINAEASLLGARKAAARARQMIDCGIDPGDHREGLRNFAKEARAGQMAQAMLTLKDAAYDYHARAIKPNHERKYAARWTASLENHVPPWLWNRPINSIMAPELLRALNGIRAMKGAFYLPSGPTIQMTVRLVRAHLDNVFDDALFYGRCTSNPAAAIRRKMGEGVPKFVRGHYPALPFQSAPLLYAKLKATSGIVARCLEFTLLTASRKAESMPANWSEFNLEEGIWTVPAERMKSRKPHVVFLPERAVEIVRSLKGIDRHYVFPSVLTRLNKPTPVSGSSLRALLRRLEPKEATTVHGLCRATFSTWAYDRTDIRSDVIEACLAHGEVDRVKAAYNRAEFQESRRMVLQAWSDFLDPDEQSNVYSVDGGLRLVSSRASASPPPSYLRLREVMVRTGYCSSTIYTKVARKTFPAPTRFGKMNGWAEAAVSEWLVKRRAELADIARAS